MVEKLNKKIIEKTNVIHDTIVKNNNIKSDDIIESKEVIEKWVEKRASVGYITTYKLFFNYTFFHK